MEMFLERGFESTTIRDIAAEVGMTRRTVYARYADKRELFKAVLERAVKQTVVPAEALKSIETDDLEAALIGVSRLRIAKMMTPVGLRLQRFLSAESHRFPEIATAVYSQITQPALDFIAELLRRHNALGTTDVEEPHRAAAALMNMVVGVPVRMALFGSPISAAEIEDRIQFSVRLFLRGVLKR